MTGGPSARGRARAELTPSSTREGAAVRRALPSARWTTMGAKNWRTSTGRPKPCRASSVRTSPGRKVMNVREQTEREDHVEGAVRKRQIQEIAGVELERPWRHLPIEPLTADLVAAHDGHRMAAGHQ